MAAAKAGPAWLPVPFSSHLDFARRHPRSTPLPSGRHGGAGLTLSPRPIYQCGAIWPVPPFPMVSRSAWFRKARRDAVHLNAIVADIDAA